MTTRVERHGDTAILRMDEQRGNALSTATIDALRRSLNEVEAKGARAVVLASAGKAFCTGLDLRECIRFDQPALARYVDSFEGLFERIFTFPLPLVAAINGHALAGGAVIALACDVRVMGTNAVLGANEVELGLPFPSMAFECVRFGIPPSSHIDGILLGKRFTAPDAVARRIAHECVDNVEAAALAWAREFYERGPRALVTMKRALRAEALLRAQANAKSSRAAFVEAFLGEEAQTRMRALVDKLEKKA